MENVTLGQKRVQRNFNPTANEVVEDLKQKYADLIDYLETLKNKVNGREISIAQTELETSCMYAVKSLSILEEGGESKINVFEEYAMFVKNLLMHKDKNLALKHTNKPQVEGILLAIIEDFRGTVLHYEYMNEKGEKIRKMI